MISVTTGILGLLGYPVGHSLSPVMQNAALQALGLDYIYLPFEVKPANLPAAIEGLRALGLQGANVTIPHKEAVLELVDELSETARKVGAVNTILVDEGKLKGDNTDAGGFIAALHEEAGFLAHSKKVLLIGAGGAARAVAVGLLDSGVSVLGIVNRDTKRAENLAAAVDSSGKRCQVIEFGGRGLDQAVEEADLIVHATSLGMYPQVENMVPLALNKLHRGQVVYDLIYNPRQTRFLAEAQQRGCHVVSGLGMLVYQGALSLEMWTGKKAPVQVMRLAAAENLKR